MISYQYVWENLQKHSRSLFARGKSGYVERIKTAQGIGANDARGPSHRNTEEGCQMDEQRVIHDSNSRKRLAIYAAGLVEAELLKHAQHLGDFEPVRSAHAMLLNLVQAIEEIPDDA